MWKNADKIVPKSVSEDRWSTRVVVYTNLATITTSSYLGSVDGIPKTTGCWERRPSFKKGEKVEFWIEKPSFRNCVNQ